MLIKYTYLPARSLWDPLEFISWASSCLTPVAIFSNIINKRALQEGNTADVEIPVWSSKLLCVREGETFWPRSSISRNNFLKHIKWFLYVGIYQYKCFI